MLLLKELLRTHTSVQCQWSEILTLTRVGGTRTCLCGDVEEAADIDFLGNVGDTQWYYLLLTLWHTLGERLRYERTFRHPEWYNYQYIRHWTLALDIGLRVLHTISIMFQFLWPKTKLKVFGLLPLHIFGCNVEISILSTSAGGSTFSLATTASSINIQHWPHVRSKDMCWSGWVERLYWAGKEETQTGAFAEFQTISSVS